MLVRWDNQHRLHLLILVRCEGLDGFGLVKQLPALDERCPDEHGVLFNFLTSWLGSVRFAWPRMGAGFATCRLRSLSLIPSTRAAG